jgi:glucose-1-phosphate cytidylyltransferase
MKNLQTVILCGGQGTRLREETEYRPKPLVDVGGRPVLWHVMKLYAHYGYLDFVMCLGYRGQMIKEYFLSYEALNNDFTICLGEKHQLEYHEAHEEQDFRVTLADTGPNSMTGSRVKQIEKYIKSDTFMVTYGDGVSDVNIEELLAFHKSHGRIATVTAFQPYSRFGILQLNNDDVVQRFSEKPQNEGWANAGFMVFNREFFDYLSSDVDCVMEQTPLERLAQKGELVAFKHKGFFYPMDTYRDYTHLNQLWNESKAPWAVWK